MVAINKVVMLVVGMCHEKGGANNDGRDNPLSPLIFVLAVDLLPNNGQQSMTCSDP